MSEPPINGVGDLRTQISGVVRRYIAHLDIDAPTELQTVRIEADGPGLHVAYAESPHGPPMLSVSINDLPGHQASPADTPEEMTTRRFMRRD